MKWITADFPGLSEQSQQKITALTTTRLGGVSSPPYSGFNVASHVQDHPCAVAANRAILRETLALPTEPYWLNQTHSNIVVELPYHYRPNANLEADASCTRLPNIVCAAMTADCLPLLVVNDDATEVAAIHAGWRGLENGVIANTLNTMSSRPEDCHVWLGPAIGAKQFEVGGEVKAQFVQHDECYANCFAPQENGKYLADIYQIAKIQLNLLGVKQVSGGQYCTFDDKEHFYSYRRDGQTGRMVSLIWIHKD